MHGMPFFPLGQYARDPRLNLTENINTVKPLLKYIVTYYPCKIAYKGPEAPMRWELNLMKFIQGH